MKNFDLGWKEMCDVVEIEASLMFDMLYTKAPVVYSIQGYLLRIISPLATFSAAILFFVYPKDSVERPDIIITYMVLALSLLLDLLWQVMALASTWM
ncbi:hypothetical protein HU200_067743 [Digitaria exilis]|uniref:DUF4220 domain-containing protein n=1 Tax=Digitaria exilis TaxID=1010633 RepID=A0A835DSJ6_9POAL|nr:hypothetical protein HU200_067743 [Digitaria exilis]